MRSRALGLDSNAGFLQRSGMDLDHLGGAFLIGLFVALAIAAIIVSQWTEHLRRKALLAVAGRLRLGFTPNRNYVLAESFAAVPGLDEGENRVAQNVLAGDFRGHPVMAFDFHFETVRSIGDGKTQRVRHDRHVTALGLARSFPRLTVAPEGLSSKIAQALGYDDIDFESHEFSRRFCVRAADRKFAYDFCNARMMAFLLDQPTTAFTVVDRHLAFVRDGRMDPADIEPDLAFAADIRELMPAYLYDT